MMISSIKDWLVDHLSANHETIETYFRDSNVTGFLIIWSIFEQRIFSGYARTSEIASVAKKFHKSYHRIEGGDAVFKHFHERYQEDRLFGNLIHKDSNATNNINTIRNGVAGTHSDKQKLEFLLFVVYRYRNNIFHGNKGVTSWTRYEEEIDKCVLIMTQLIDISTE